MRRFYLEKGPESDLAVIAGDEARHIEKVLRLAVGDGVELFDREGTVYRGSIERLHRSEVLVRIAGQVPCATGPAAEIVLCQAIVKSQKMDLIVQKCTELGVSAVQPFFALRSVPRWDGHKAAQRAQHWQNIACAAVKQSGARKPPGVAPVCNFAEMLQAAYPGHARLMLWEGAARVDVRSLFAAMTEKKLVLLIGPEGGFSDDEVEAARRQGFQVAGLGERILRAETAAIAAVTIAAYELGIVGGGG